MELQKIEQLLEKYWDGDTTLEEEQVLQRFFTEEKIPDHLQGVATLFQKFNTDRQFNTLDDHFDGALIHKIEKSSSGWSFRSLLRIAAAVTLLLLSVFLIKDYTDKTGETAEVTKSTENSFEDPKLAYEQTKQALLLISSMMNEGTQHIEKLENFSEAQEKVKENTL